MMLAHEVVRKRKEFEEHEYTDKARPGIGIINLRSARHCVVVAAGVDRGSFPMGFPVGIRFRRGYRAWRHPRHRWAY